MGDIIYWNEFDVPKKVVNPITKKEHEVRGEYVCKDERVEKFWFYGCTSQVPNSGVVVRASLLFKKKENEETWHRWESEPVDVFSNPDSPYNEINNLINQAEQYLKEFK